MRRAGVLSERGVGSAPPFYRGMYQVWPFAPFHLSIRNESEKSRTRHQIKYGQPHGWFRLLPPLDIDDDSTATTTARRGMMRWGGALPPVAAATAALLGVASLRAALPADAYSQRGFTVRAALPSRTERGPDQRPQAASVCYPAPHAAAHSRRQTARGVRAMRSWRAPR